MKCKKLVATLTLIPTLILAGCSTSSNAPEETLSLKIGVMPAVDTAPIYLAEEKGYFDELGLDLTIELFNNAGDRQTALQTYAIDGAMTDLIAVATNINGGFDLKATTLTDGVFPVLVGAGYEETPEIKVAMMEVSVSNFLIDEWLGDDYTIEKVFINDIPSRLEIIKSGQVDMAITDKALTEKEEAIARFHEGYNKAAQDLMENPDEARTLLIEKLNLNPAIQDDIILPTYSLAHLPEEAYIQKIMDWSSETLNQELNLVPSNLIEGKFVNND